MARVLVTRPAADAEALADILQKRGHEPVMAPLLFIEDRDLAVDPTGAQAILFTSANGVRAASNAFSQRTILVLCVGEATAQ